MKPENKKSSFEPKRIWLIVHDKPNNMYLFGHAMDLNTIGLEAPRATPKPELEEFESEALMASRLDELKEEPGWYESYKNPKPVRARDVSGKFIKDDPSTPDYNEAWEGGEAP